MAELSRPDLCIVGAGTLGTALARHARGLDAKVVLVDRGDHEGVDGREVPLRLAALQASAARAHAQRNAALFGIASSEPKINFRGVQESLTRAANEHAPLDSIERLTAQGIEVLKGEVRFTDSQILQVGETQVRARAFILALGSLPIVPAIPGLEEVEVFTPDTILQSSRKLTHLLILGAGAESLVLAQSFARLGSRVTLVPHGPVLAGYDHEAASLLLRVLADEGVRIVEGGAITAIQPRSQGIGATLELPGGEREALDVSHILNAMGGAADLAPLDPTAARLRPGRTSGDFLQGDMGLTSNRRIRLAGAAAGVEQWQHAVRHGRAVVETLLLGTPRQKLAPEPRLVATEPALVQIGRLPGSADKVRPGGGLYRANLAENEQARIAGQGQGFVKVLTAPGGKLLGASLVGAGAADMAALLTLLMERSMTLDVLADLSVPHPSLFSVVVSLGDSYRASRPESAWTVRWRGLRRALPF